MILYEFLYWGRSVAELEMVIKTKQDLGKSPGSYYGFYNSRGASVSSAQPCWRGYKCFQYSSSSRPYRMGLNVRSVSGANGTFDIIEVFEGESDKPSYVVSKYLGCAKRIDSNVFAVRG